MRDEKLVVEQSYSSPLLYGGGSAPKCELCQRLPIPPNNLVTIAEASRQTGISYGRLYHAMKNGRIPSYEIHSAAKYHYRMVQLEGVTAPLPERLFSPACPPLTSPWPRSTKGYSKLFLAVFGCPKLLESESCGRNYEFVDHLPVNTEVNGQQLFQVMEDVLMTFTDRERFVLRLRFGLVDDERSRTQEETGRQLGVSGERIKQIESKGLRKLRHPSHHRLLQPFLYRYTEEDTVATEGRHRVYLYLSQYYTDQLARNLASRITRTHLAAALQSIKENLLPKLNRAIVFSCQVITTFEACSFCNEPIPPGLDWCLEHLPLRSRIIVICDGCGVKFARYPSTFVRYTAKHGKTQSAVFHSRSCLWANAKRLGINQRNRVPQRVPAKHTELDTR